VTGRAGQSLAVRADLAHGGRWTSLATPEREWLWRNPRVPDAARAAVEPGDPFVDAGVEPGYAAPVSFVVWRNLGGWPDGAPYRSIGVEPLLGAETNLDRAARERLAHLDGGGRMAWWLEASASR
jgi:hypothetical protein